MAVVYGVAGALIAFALFVLASIIAQWMRVLSHRFERNTFSYLFIGFVVGVAYGIWH